MSDRTVQACPDCDSTHIHRRTEQNGHTTRRDESPERWRCSGCGLRFDDPVERIAGSDGGRSGLAGRLAAIGEQQGGDSA